MNQKDYKEIAKIMNISGIKGLDEFVYRLLKNKIDGLVDYFEKRPLSKLARMKLKMLQSNRISEQVKNKIHSRFIFNKKQFLKDCGVEDD